MQLPQHPQPSLHEAWEAQGFALGWGERSRWLLQAAQVGQDGVKSRIEVGAGQERSQIGGEGRVQTGPELSRGVDVQAVAAVAERLRDRADEPDHPAAGKKIAPG